MKTTKLHAGICEQRTGQPVSPPRQQYWQGLFVACSVILGSTLNAATFTVTTSADSGPGSLRQAILDANANPGPDEISFNIPAAGVQTINPLTPPPIITDPVHIDGYTQPGAATATATSAATILIELSGALLPGGPGVNGFALVSGSSGSSIRGLSINRFKRVVGGTGHCIIVSPGSGSHWIAGNYLNVAPDGSTVFTGSPSFGDGYDDTGAGNNIIGYDPSGPNSANPAADRNIISGSGNARIGLLVAGTSAGNQIRGNFIGADASGTSARGNSFDGIGLQTGGNVIENNLISGNNRFGIISFISGANIIRGNNIGTDVSGTLGLGNSAGGIRLQTGGNVIENNLVSANGGAGIGLFSFGNNSVTGNKIGTDVTGTLDLGNKASAGILVQAGSGNNSIGGLAEGDGNTIAFNPIGVGIGPGAAPGNSILGNSIFSNDGLGIDLGRDGVTLSDGLDADVGDNNFQNFPVINGQKSLRTPALVQVWGSLDSKPSQQYLIQIFSSALADPSGYGEGQQLVGNVTVSTDVAGHAEFHFPAKLDAPVGSIISATATDLLTGDTSEFSKWENVNEKGSPTAYEHAAGAAGGDGNQGNPHHDGDTDDLIRPQPSVEE
jgi:parallel beta-helix repeat protein